MSFLDPHQLIQELPLKKGDTVLDLGAGSGAFSIEVAKLVGDEGRVIALDIDAPLLESLIATAHKLGFLQVSHIVANIHDALPFQDYMFDGVIVANILHQRLDVAHVLQEIKRVVAPHGYVLITDWSDSYNHMGPHPDHIVHTEELLAYLHALSFKVVKRLPAGEFHFAFLVESE